LIQGITDLRPTAASRILSRMLKSHSRVRPGDVARRLPASVAATILTDMDPAEAAQIMAEMGERAASKLVKHYQASAPSWYSAIWTAAMRPRY